MLDVVIHKHALGTEAGVTLVQAREMADQQRALLAQGIDPREHREAVELQEEARRVTFDSMAADYIAAHRSGWKNAKHAQQWENTLQTYASPIIGKLAPGDV